MAEDTKENRWQCKNPIVFNDLSNLKITVTGGSGFLGRHVVKELILRGAMLENIYVPRSKENDLRLPENASTVTKNRDLVIHLAASVGGIGFNKMNPAQLIYDNAMMGLNLIHESYKNNVQKLVVAGTVCAYPKITPVPFKEEHIWDGYPEETNAPYGVAKKTLLVALQAYREQHDFHGIYLLPTNLYGPHDNFDLESSHVIPAIIRKFLEAKDLQSNYVSIWGDGSPSREFLYVEDCARGIVDAALKYDGMEPINLGTNQETTIKELITTVQELVGFNGNILWDTSKPNGQPRRKLDTTRAHEAFGFDAKINLLTGLRRTIDWYLVHRHRSATLAKTASDKAVSPPTL